MFWLLLEGIDRGGVRIAVFFTLLLTILLLIPQTNKQHNPQRRINQSMIQSITSENIKATTSVNTNKTHLSCIFANVRATAPVIRSPRSLPPNFVPSNYDVICAKGKKAFNSIGNRRFRVLIDVHLQSYKDAPTKLEKTAIVNSIVEVVRGVASAGFIKIDGDEWIEVGDVAAREKVGQTIRDVLSQRDPVKRAKKMRRQAKQRKMMKLEKELEKEAQQHTAEIAAPVAPLSSLCDWFAQDIGTMSTKDLEPRMMNPFTGPLKQRFEITERVPRAA